MPLIFDRLSRLIRPVTRTNSDPFQMRRTFRADEGIVVPVLAEEYRALHYTPEYSAQWIALLNTDSAWGVWDEKRFSGEIMGTLISGTEILLTNEEKLIGAAAAVALPEQAPNAVLAYPVMHPSYRRRGLGVWLIANTLACCQAVGYPAVVLRTDEARLPAIRTYLKLGFVPDLQAFPRTKMRWEKVMWQVHAFGDNLSLTRNDGG